MKGDVAKFVESCFTF